MWRFSLSIVLNVMIIAHNKNDFKEKDTAVHDLVPLFK
jgi:hypothetical protein